MINRLVLPAIALGLLAACATNAPDNAKNEPDYQIGLTGKRQAKIDAERAHAGASPQAVLPADADSDPRVLSSEFPGYPHELRKAGIEGRVVVRFVVEPDGSVSGAGVEGSPPPELAALALAAIQRWKFTPAMKDGAPIRVRLRQPFLFQME